MRWCVIELSTEIKIQFLWSCWITSRKSVRNIQSQNIPFGERKGKNSICIVFSSSVSSLPRLIPGDTLSHYKSCYPVSLGHSQGNNVPQPVMWYFLIQKWWKKLCFPWIKNVLKYTPHISMGDIYIYNFFFAQWI